MTSNPWSCTSDLMILLTSRRLISCCVYWYHALLVLLWKPPHHRAFLLSTNKLSTADLCQDITDRIMEAQGQSKAEFDLWLTAAFQNVHPFCFHPHLVELFSVCVILSVAYLWACMASHLRGPFLLSSKINPKCYVAMHMLHWSNSLLENTGPKCKTGRKCCCHECRHVNTEPFSAHGCFLLIIMNLMHTGTLGVPGEL